jgi:hypothetical protein
VAQIERRLTDTQDHWEESPYEERAKPEIIAVGFAFALVILSIGVVKWVNSYVRHMRHRPPAADAGIDELGQRLDVIEGRLRDITDVMISVSEKVDNIDQTRP